MSAADSPATRLRRQIEFIVECDKLKEIFRQTINTQSRRAENDAEHSWHLCLCVIVLAEHANQPDLDVLRVLKMVIVHDLVEIDAGDTFAYDAAAMAGQHEREALAAARIFGLLPSDQAREFRALWDEFEAKKTPEARFATAVDRFQPMLLNCRTQGAA
ncbi:MAG TPA: HD domain-containing protein [Opitutus sp.]|nr:HD domain-containing protein [Opitutus sp.]